MATFYEEMQDTATEVLTEFSQGTVTLRRRTPGEPDPAHPYDPPASVVADYPLAATVRRVSRRYIDGTLIIATDEQVSFAVPPVVPRMSDAIVIDGRELVLKDLRPVPSAGTPVAYIAFFSR